MNDESLRVVARLGIRFHAAFDGRLDYTAHVCNVLSHDEGVRATELKSSRLHGRTTDLGNVLAGLGAPDELDRPKLLLLDKLSNLVMRCEQVSEGTLSEST